MRQPLSGGLMNEHIELETRIYIHPKQSRYFDIYPETAIPYEHHCPCAKIQLCEVIDLGYDYAMIPLQVYITSDPFLYKLVAIVDCVKCDTPCIPLVEINEQNIRTYQMTKNGQVFMPKFERTDITDLDFEINKKVEYQLVDITPEGNYTRSCGLQMNHTLSERKLLSETERRKLFLDEGKINYIKHQFGFQERNIILLPDNPDDPLGSIRFQVLAISYYYSPTNGKLSIVPD